MNEPQIHKLTNDTVFARLGICPKEHLSSHSLVSKVYIPSTRHVCRPCLAPSGAYVMRPQVKNKPSEKQNGKATWELGPRDFADITSEPPTCSISLELWNHIHLRSEMFSMQFFCALWYLSKMCIYHHTSWSPKFIHPRCGISADHVLRHQVRMRWAQIKKLWKTKWKTNLRVWYTRSRWHRPPARTYHRTFWSNVYISAAQHAYKCLVMLLCPQVRMRRVQMKNKPSEKQNGKKKKKLESLVHVMWLLQTNWT